MPRLLAARLSLARSQDTFVRANQAGWGTATNPDGSSEGEAWTLTNFTTTNATITSNSGQITGVTSLGTCLLGSQTLTDGEVWAKVAVSNATDIVGVVMRATGSSAHYSARFLTGGTVFAITKRVSSTDTNLATTTVSVAAASNYWIRLRALTTPLGTNLYAMLWADGTTMPSTWTLSVLGESSITTAGAYGIRCALNAVGHTATFSSFIAADTASSTQAGDASTRLLLQENLHYFPRALGSLYSVDATTYQPRSFGSAILYGQRTAADVSSRVRFGSSTPNTQDAPTRLRLAESLEYAPRSFGGDYPTNALFYQPRSFGSAILSGWGNLLDASIRLKVLAVQKRDQSSRLRLITSSIRAIAARLHLGGGSGYRNTVISDNPRAYYRLDTTTGTTVPDESGNGYTATLVEPVTFSQVGALSGDPDSATLFTTGSSSLVLPPTLAPSTWTALSLEFWISISSGYQHVVITTDATATTLYLNGSPYTPAAGDPVLIDTALAYAGSYLAGTLDEVALYNYVLSSGQVQAHFLAAVPRPAVATRLRALAATRRDAGLRLFFSPPIFSVRSLFARTRLLAVGKQDASSRLVFSFPRALRDGSLRLILRASVGKDTALRLRTLAVGKLNQAARLSFFPTPLLVLATRCVLGVQRFRDYGTRCVVRAASIDIWPQAARIRLLAVARRDVAARIVFLSTQLVLLSSRLRLRTQTQRDAILRLLLVGTRVQDQASRLRVLSSSLTLSDAKLRLRVLATQAADSATRFVFALPRMRDAQARLVVRAADIDFWPLSARLKVLVVTRLDQALRLLLFVTHSTDLKVRLRLLARLQQDSITRLLLLAIRFTDSATRLRLLPSFVVVGGTITRLSLLAARARDVSARCVFGVQRFRDYASRVLLRTMSVDLLDGQLRLRLLAIGKLNQATRVVVVATRVRDQALRLRLLAVAVQGITTRLLLLAQRRSDVPTRLRVLTSFTILADITYLLRVVSSRTTDSTLRLVFGVLRIRDFAARMTLRAQNTNLFDATLRLRLAFSFHALNQTTLLRLLPSVVYTTALRCVLAISRARDYACRLVLRASNINVGGIATRLRLLVRQSRDASLRLRLAVALLLVSRTRLLSPVQQNTLLRLLLLSTSVHGIAVRLPLLEQRFSSATTRLRFLRISVDILPQSSRLRLLGVALWDSTTRLRLVLVRQLPLRLRLLAISSHDGFTRLRTLSVAKRDQAARLRSLALRVADDAVRLRLLSRPFSSTSLRLRFGSVIPRAQDTPLRLLLTPLTLVTTLSTRDGQTQCLSRESASGLSLRDGATVLVARPPTL